MPAVHSVLGFLVLHPWYANQYHWLPNRNSKKYRRLVSLITPTDSGVQAENEALQQLVMDVAHNKQEAHRKVAGLKQKYGNLLAKVNHTKSAVSLLFLVPLLLLLMML